MDLVRLQRIGNRINILLSRELGQSVDVSRLINDPLYARDVLLVCDALPGSDLASLAQHFRTALAEPARPVAAGASAQPPQPPQPSTLPGEFDSLPGPPRTPKRWYLPTRWLGR